LPVPEIDAQNEPFCQLSDSIISTTFHNKKNMGDKMPNRKKKLVGLACSSKGTKRRVARLGGLASAKSRAKKL